MKRTKANSESSQENQSTLNNLTENILPKIGVIVGSFSGIGVVFTAIGYLAERSHLRMLGFTNMPVDLNQYLYSGLHFVGFFPTYIVVLALGTLEKHPVATILILAGGLSAWLVWYYFLRPKRKLNKVKKQYRSLLALNWVFAVLLILLLCGQIFGLVWLTNVAKVKNMLYQNTQYLGCQEPRGAIPLAAFTDKIKYWITTNDNIRLGNFFFKLFCIPLATGLIIRYLMARNTGSRKEKVPLLNTVLLSFNFLLLSTQVIFIPINYGALLLAKEYPQVKIEEKPNSNAEEDKSNLNRVVQPTDNRKSYTHSSNNHVVATNSISLECSHKSKTNHKLSALNDIRNQILWEYPVPFTRDLGASPKIFFVPDGDTLSYSKPKLSAPKKFTADIIDGILKVDAIRDSVQFGDTTWVTIKASHKGDTDSTKFRVEYKNIKNKPPEKQFAPEPSQLQTGTYMNESIQTWFKDPDNGDILSYTAKSTNPSKVRAIVSESRLFIVPISPGSADIEIWAYDGRSRSEKKITCTIEVLSSETKKIELWAGHKADLIDLQCIFDVNLSDDVKHFSIRNNAEISKIALLPLPDRKLSVEPIAVGTDLIEICALHTEGFVLAKQLCITIKDYPAWPEDDFLTLLYKKDKLYYLYSPSEKRVRLVNEDKMKSVVFYGQKNIFRN